MLNQFEQSAAKKPSIFNREQSGLLTKKGQTTSYQFKVQNRSLLTTRLDVLSGNADLLLWTKNGQLINQSRRRGTRVDSIRSTLKPGIYRLEVVNRDRRTRYNLRLSSDQPRFASLFPQTRAAQRSNTSSLVVSSSTSSPTSPTSKKIGDGAFPAASGSNIVWQRYDGNDRELFVSDGETARQITDDTIDIYSYDISGTNVVWSGSDGEIYFYDGTRNSKLTSNGRNKNPKISGSNIVWERGIGSDSEIYYQNGVNGQPIRLTQDSNWDEYVSISGSNIVWQKQTDNGWQIFASFNGGAPTQISTGPGNNWFPDVSGSNIVWTGVNGVQLYQNGQIKVLSNGLGISSSSYPKVSGDNVVWYALPSDSDRVQYEIYFYNGSQTQRLTNNSFDDIDPQISDSNVVWTGGYSPANVYLYDGSKTIKISNLPGEIQGYNDTPRISGSTIVWRKSDGNGGNGEIRYVDLSASANQGNISTIANGLDRYLTRLNNAVFSQVLQNNLPLLGAQLQNSPVSQFIGQIKSKIQSSFQTVNVSTGNPVQQALFNALGNGSGGLGVLQDLNGDQIITINDIQIINPGSQNVEFKLRLGKVETFTTVLSRDLGLPGLNLNIGGNANVQSSFALDLNFGYRINSNDLNDITFYAKTDDSEELSLNLNLLSFNPNTGKFGFFPVTSSNGGTGLTSNFSVNINDSSDAGSELSIAELQGLSDANLVSASLTGNSNIKLNLATNLSSFPTLRTQLQVDWGLNTTKIGPNQPVGGVPRVIFNDAKLDMGTFMNNFLNPIFQKINSVTAPINQVTSNLTKPIPFLTKLLKRNVSLLDLADILAKSNPGNTKPNLAYIRAAAEIVRLVSNIPNAAGVALNLGSLDLGNVDVRSSNYGLASFNPVGRVASALRYEGQNALAVQNFLQPLQSGSTAAGSIQLPILSDPVEAFKLLLGRTDAELFRYAMPTLSAQVNGGETIPVVGPIGIRLEGTVGAAINLKFGFDATGLNRYLGTNDAADILQYGFYLDANTAPLTVSAGLRAGPAVDIKLARVFVAGGVLGTVNFNWKDDNNPRDPGKVRLNEIAANLGTLNIFTLSGRVDAVMDLDAFVVGLARYQQNFGNFEVLNFGGRPPTLAQQKKGNIPFLQDILDLAKPVRDAIAKLGIKAASEIFGARNARKAVDALKKFDKKTAPLLEKSGFLILAAATPVGSLSLLIEYGPSVIQAINKANIDGKLKNLEKDLAKGGQKAKDAAKKLDRTVTLIRTEVKEAKELANKPVQFISNVGTSIKEGFRSIF